MPRSTPIAHSLLALITLGGLAGTALAGPLVPPAGPVASTMKTLAEVEARTAITQANTPGDAVCVFRITQPGSYYLTGNIAGNASKGSIIVVAADGVTIDLNGFQITGGGSSYGINGGAVRGTTIINGSMKDLGTAGVVLDQSRGTTIREVRIISAGEGSLFAGTNATVERVTVVQPGTSGITVGAASTVRACTVAGGSVAFSATKSVLEGCAATGASEIGFSVGENSTVTDCTASGCASGFQAAAQARFTRCGALASTGTGSSGVGILTGFNSIVDGCTAANGAADGITANDGSVVRSSTSTNNAAYGIVVDGRCTIAGNTCNSNGANPQLVTAGIRVNGSDNRIEANNLIGNDYGIQAVNSGNIIIRNTASNSSATNYNSVGGNVWGAVVQPASTPAFNANTGVGGTGTTDPNANFSF